MDQGNRLGLCRLAQWDRIQRSSGGDEDHENHHHRQPAGALAVRWGKHCMGHDADLQGENNKPEKDELTPAWGGVQTLFPHTLWLF
jgi:hypothetical protein